MEINIAGAGAGKTTKMSDKIILLRNQIDENKKIQHSKNKYCIYDSASRYSEINLCFNIYNPIKKHNHQLGK